MNTVSSSWYFEFSFFWRLADDALVVLISTAFAEIRWWHIDDWDGVDFGCFFDIATNLRVDGFISFHEFVVELGFMSLFLLLFEYVVLEELFFVEGEVLVEFV